MKYLKNSLMLTILFFAASASANALESSLLIPVGLYEGDPKGACSVDVKVDSKLWNTHTVTVFEKSINSNIIPDSIVKSDPFSFKKMDKQVLENDGNFLIVTKNTSSKTHKISGSIFEKNGSLFWEITVSREACLGFCTSSVATCTVQIPQ